MIPMIPPEQMRPNSASLAFPVVVLMAVVFFFFFDVGQFYMDRTKNIGMTFSVGMSFAAMWTVKTVLRKKDSRQSRIRAFSVIAGLLVIPIVSGISMGKDEAYPPASRALVDQIGARSRDIKTIKDHIRERRESFTQTEQLLSIEPLIISWRTDVDEISKINNQISHDALPRVVEEILKILSEAIVFDRQQVQNLDKQLNVIRAAGHQGSAKRKETYEQQLGPLMEQEMEIERQRQASNLEQRLNGTVKKGGA
jgi:hypothetical protein